MSYTLNLAILQKSSLMQLVAQWVFASQVHSNTEDWTLGKAKKRFVSKRAVKHSILGERLFFNISWSSTSTLRGKKHWLPFIEDNYAWSYFLKEKSQLKNVLLGLIKNLKIMIFRSVDFGRACRQERMGMEFKYTAPGTSQKNGHVEWKFTTLFDRVHAMLNGRKFFAFLRNSLELKSPTLPPFLSKISSLPIRI